MPEALAAAIAAPGLFWLVAAALAAGTLYGFAGFGAALLFMPVAARVTDPLTAVPSFALAALASVVTVLPGAWAACDRRASLWVAGVALLFLPLGVLVLRFGDPVALRWGVSAVVLLTLAALLAGWRYTFTPGVPAWMGVGAGVGFLGGSTGLNGPPLILFQLGGQDSAARTRANTIVPLTITTIAVLPVLVLQGALPFSTVVSGALLFPAYAVGTLVGRRLFDPDRAGLYRMVAYAVIAASALIGLPLFD